MASNTLIIFNKKYSSWSLRPWLVLKYFGIPFDEKIIWIRKPDTAEKVAPWSPSGRLPAFHYRDVVVWDSLAICEFLADRFPEKPLWPADATERALARCMCAEMHAGFTALRTQLPMNCTQNRTLKLSAEVQADVTRIQNLWRQCREKSEPLGNFLFGNFGIVDAFFAPVVIRFKTNGVPMDAACQAYTDAIWNLPEMQDWIKAGQAESEVVPENE